MTIEMQVTTAGGLTKRGKPRQRAPGAGRPPDAEILPLDVRTRLAEARAKKEEGLARKVALEVKAREGELVSAKEARNQGRRAGMVFRDTTLSWPARWAATLAAMTDEREIERYLTAEIRSELTRLAQIATEDAEG